MICKTLREGVVPVGERSEAFYTERLNADDVSALGDVGPEPYLFQELVEKRYDIRVTVVGEQVFASRIESQDHEQAETDWRKADAEALPHAVEDLPGAISKRCALLAGSYGLRFAAIDLARRIDGGYTFFELNPNGQWAWIEQRTRLPLRSAVAEELTGTRA